MATDPNDANDDYTSSLSNEDDKTTTLRRHVDEETTTPFEVQSSPWKHSFDQLDSFHKKNGHCDIRQSNNPSLHSWANEQRCLYAANLLDEQRKLELESISFDWTAGFAVADRQWHTDDKNMFDQLFAFQKTHGHCNVPRCANETLYEWVNEKRRHFVSNTLNEDQKRELDSIGFEWTNPLEETPQREKLDATWNKQFDQLLHYRATNGHCNVRECEKKSLYTWVQSQRQHFESKELQEKQKKQLDSIGFEWTAPPETTRHGILDTAWKSKFSQLRDYHKMNGHCNVRACENKSLYNWARAQMRLFYSNTLDEDRRRQLDSIGFEWTAPRSRKALLDATWKKISINC